MTDSTTPTPSEELYTSAPTEEALLAYLFGDDACDPGPLLSRVSHNAEAHRWLEAFARDYARLSGAPSGPAIDRAEALLAELKRRSARGGAELVSLAAHRARKSSWIPRLAVAAVLLATIGAAVYLAMSVGKSTREVDVLMAENLVSEIMNTEGYGFAGAPPPTPRERGFLIGAVTDLSRPRKATGQTGDKELELARNLADRALEGLDDAPEAAEERRQRLLGGCVAILKSPEERRACEDGLADYQRRRDVY